MNKIENFKTFDEYCEFLNSIETEQKIIKILILISKHLLK